MIKLDEILDLNLLDDMVGQGYINISHHPSMPLRIYKYSNSAQYDSVWNEATEVCRGIIVDDNDVIITRPFRKFHNYTQFPLPKKALTTPPFVTNKLDGSCIQLYKYNGFTECATLGSFESTQGRWATRWMREEHPFFSGDPEVTYLFEMIHPSNRIVVDYGDRAELVLIGAIEVATGKDILLWEITNWHGSTVEQFYDLGHIDKVYHFANGVDFSDQEGVVACWYDHYGPSFRLKIKNVDYIRLHSLYSHLSTRKIWELLKAGTDTEQLAAMFPDETYSWIRQEADILLEQFNAHLVAFQEAWDNTLVVRNETDHLEYRERKKYFAKVAVKSKYSSVLFAKYDNKGNIYEMLWDMVKPTHTKLYWENLNDEA